MFKITAAICILLFVSSAWAGCDSCGRECAPSCGTRRFRACCFNYLRRKRGPELAKIHTMAPDMRNERNSEVPMYVVESIPAPERWISNDLSSENQHYSLEDMLENRLK